MKRQLMHSTQCRVDLALNIISRRNGKEQLVTLNLIALTGLIFWLWTVVQTVNRLHSEGLLVVHDISQTASIIGKLVMIGFNVLAFGVGVKL